MTRPWTAYDQGRFDAGLDYHQQLLANAAGMAEEMSYIKAARPDAVAEEVTFADLHVGDYMTNEGPSGRWVLVRDLRGPSSYVRSKHPAVPDGMVAVLFEIPEPVTVSGETRYWVERPPTEPVVIDRSTREEVKQHG